MKRSKRFIGLVVDPDGYLGEEMKSEYESNEPRFMYRVLQYRTGNRTGTTTNSVHASSWHELGIDLVVLS